MMRAITGNQKNKPKIKTKQVPMKIQAIKPQVHRRDRRTIYLDNGDVFGISEDVLLSHPVKVGDELSAEDIQALKDADDAIKVREAAFRLLSYRQRSRAELTTRLIEKDFDRHEIQSTIEYLTKKGYLDDEKFALAFARDKVRNKHIGPFALKMELIPHRLDANLTEMVLTEIYQEFPIDDLIDSLLDKKHINSGEKPGPKQKKRIIDFLKRKGFSWDQIKAGFERRGIEN